MPCNQGSPCGPGPLYNLGVLGCLSLLIRQVSSIVDLGTKEGLRVGQGGAFLGDGLTLLLLLTNCLLEQRDCVVLYFVIAE